MATSVDRLVVSILSFTSPYLLLAYLVWFPPCKCHDPKHDPLHDFYVDASEESLKLSRTLSLVVGTMLTDPTFSTCPAVEAFQHIDTVVKRLAF